ncbi:MAG: MFS transporter, partial [Maricaulaceae bacterium]
MSDIPQGLTRTMITICVIAGAAMVILDSTIAVIALPNMAAALGATHDTVAWVLTSFVVALAVATPLTGVACDRFGRKRVALAAITLFALASALCGAANNLGEMVAFRIAQGAAGAMLVPIAQSTLLDINPPERHGQAMGLFGSSVVIAP